MEFGKQLISEPILEVEFRLIRLGLYERIKSGFSEPPKCCES
jgi:hypothetical protein